MPIWRPVKGIASVTQVETSARVAWRGLGNPLERGVHGSLRTTQVGWYFIYNRGTHDAPKTGTG